MIDFIQYFKNNITRTKLILNELGFQLVEEKKEDIEGYFPSISYEYKFNNSDLFINLYIAIHLYEDNTYLISLSMFNKKENESNYTWDSFFLSDYIKDNNLQDKFIYKTQGDENVEEFIDQYFKNLEFALNNYLKPYVTGEKYIDHYQRMRDQFYDYTSFEQEEKKIIKEHLAKQGKMAILRQMVIGFKQDVRNYMDKIKNFFLPPNLR